MALYNTYRGSNVQRVVTKTVNVAVTLCLYFGVPASNLQRLLLPGHFFFGMVQGRFIPNHFHFVIHQYSCHLIYRQRRIISNKRLAVAGYGIWRSWETRNVYVLLATKSLANSPLLRQKNRWDDNIKLDIMLTYCMCVRSRWNWFKMLSRRWTSILVVLKPRFLLLKCNNNNNNNKGM